MTERLPVILSDDKGNSDGFEAVRQAQPIRGRVGEQDGKTVGCPFQVATGRSGRERLNRRNAGRSPDAVEEVHLEGLDCDLHV